MWGDSLIVVLMYISLMMSDVEHLFILPVGHLDVFLGEMSNQALPIFKSGYLFFVVVSYFYQKKNAIGVWCRLILQIALGSMDILAILHLLNNEHRMSFHFFPSLISFSNGQFYKSFTSLVKFIWGISFFIWCCCKWDRFLTLLLGLLTVSRNTTDFCMLVWYPATLLNLLTGSTRFFCGIFRVFYI